MVFAGMMVWLDGVGFQWIVMMPYSSYMSVCMVVLTILLLCILSNVAYAQNGMKTIESRHNVADTADKLINIIEKRGLKLFARINHAKNAANLDMTLRPTELVIFGNPKVGTPLMQCAQTTGLDLPQKILVWEDERGNTYITYNAPKYLKKRHGIVGCKKILEKVASGLTKLTQAAAN